MFTFMFRISCPGLWDQNEKIQKSSGVKKKNEINEMIKNLLMVFLTLWSSFLRRCLPSRPCSGSWSHRRVTQRKCCWRRSSDPWRRGFDSVPIRKLPSQKQCGPERRIKRQSIIQILIPVCSDTNQSNKFNLIYLRLVLTVVEEQR